MDELNQLFREMKTEFSYKLSSIEARITSSEEIITSQITAHMNQKFEGLNKDLEYLQSELENQEKRISAIEKHNMQRNLVFFGVEQNDKRESYFQLQDKILDIINNQMKIKTERFEIQSVKRFGNIEKKPRPISVCLTTLGKKIQLLKNKKFLVGLNIRVQEEFPKKVLDVRRDLKIKQKMEIEKGNIAYIKYDKLIIKDKKELTHNKRVLSESPEHISPNENNYTQKKKSHKKYRANSNSITSYMNTKTIPKTQEYYNKTTLPSRLVIVGDADQNPPEQQNININIDTEQSSKMKHNNLYLATYNVRSLSSHERLLELDTALKRIKFDVIGLSETKRLGNSIEEYRNFILFYIGQTPGLHGVGFIVKKYLKENILNFNGLSERVAILNLSFDKLKLSIIQVYAPTEAAPDEDIKEFYKTLNTALSMSNRNVIVMGDFNAKIGQAKSGENSIIKYGYGTRNGRGEMLIEFAFENNLPILNTFFKKKDKRRWTWRSPDGSTKNEIDFILSNLKGNVTNIEVIDLPFSSDHRQKIKPKTRSMKNELSALYKLTSKYLKADYEEHRKNIIEKHLTSNSSMKKAYKELRTHKSWITSLHDSTNMVHNRRDILKIATAFYKKLYSESRVENVTHMNDIAYNEEPSHTEYIPFDITEVLSEIKKLKNDKSPGSDKVSNEAIKTAGLCLACPLTKLFNEIIEKGVAPRQWTESTIILLYKKGNPHNISNYRPISILPCLYKLFASLIEKRIKGTIESSQPIEQAGFRSGFSTIDNIHAIEILIEKFQEYRKPLYIGFIDYKKAFDSLTYQAIWKTLLNLNINQEYIKILKHLYENSTSKIQLESTGPPFAIKRGVKQGDPLSPKIFIAVLESALSTLQWKNLGIYIRGKYLSHLRFADDIAIFSESSAQMNLMVNSLNEASKKAGLEINFNKSKIMTNHIETPIIVENTQLEFINKYIYLGKQISFQNDRNEEEIERRIKFAWNKFWSMKEVLKSQMPMKLKIQSLPKIHQSIELNDELLQRLNLWS
ncbi:uncharacterized protein LOC128198192 [Bicyclus anynana]|uniref:Uncharacterized protein LOC128198192 n=1 Tax=Bicyclus anynana TaxID=110368 RepID=A0ABM3LGF5_BICAN|nr:uncharacterized protein LOC128198192 [Bicyclus anynana]